MKRCPATFSLQLCSIARSSIQIQCYIHQTVQSDFIRGWRKGEVGNKGTFNIIMTQELFWLGGDIFSMKKIFQWSVFPRTVIAFYLHWKGTKVGFRRPGPCASSATHWSHALVGDFSLSLHFPICNVRKLDDALRCPFPLQPWALAEQDVLKPGAFEFVGFDLTLLCITRDRDSLSGKSPICVGMWQRGFWREDSCGVSAGLPSNPKHPHFPALFSLKRWVCPQVS